MIIEGTNLANHPGIEVDPNARGRVAEISITFVIVIFFLCVTRFRFLNEFVQFSVVAVSI